MARLIAALLRHGDYKQLPQTPSAHQPFALTEKGENQARRAAAILRDVVKTKGWVLSPSVDSSNLLRAWQTAQIITTELTDLFPNPPILVGYDTLAERGLGSAANLTENAIESIIREDPRFPELPADWKSNSNFQLPLQGAESLLQAGERVAKHMNQQMKEQLKTNVNDTLKLFIGHGAAFRHAAYYLGVMDYKQITLLSMHHAKPVYIEYERGDTWRHIDGSWKIRGKDNRYND